MSPFVLFFLFSLFFPLSLRHRIVARGMLRAASCVKTRQGKRSYVFFFFVILSFFYSSIVLPFFFFYSSLRSFIFFCLILFFRLFGSLGRFFFFFPLFLVFYRSEVSAAVQAVILNYLKTKKKNNKKKRTRGRERLVQSE